MPVKAVLLDFDGTLVDTMDLYAEKAGKLISERYGVDEKTAKELYLKTSGLPFVEQLNELFPEEKEKNREVASLFEEWKKEALKGVRLPKSSLDFLRSLKKRGLYVVITSNNLQNYVEEVLRKSGASVDLVLGWDGGSFRKLRPHLSYALSKLGLKKEEVLFVGDSKRDEEMAREAGVRFLRADVKNLDKVLKEIE